MGCQRFDESQDEDDEVLDEQERILKDYKSSE